VTLLENKGRIRRPDVGFRLQGEARNRKGQRLLVADQHGDALTADFDDAGISETKRKQLTLLNSTTYRSESASKFTRLHGESLARRPHEMTDER
jgi:hypothetical protein